MLNEEYIKMLEDSSKFNLNIEEKKYILNKFSYMLKNCDKLSNLPKIDQFLLNNIEDEIM